MKLPCMIFKKIVFNTSPKTVEHILLVMYKSTLSERLFQPLKSTNKQFKLTATFSTCYIAIISTITN